MESLHSSVIIGVLAMAALYLGAVRLSGRKVTTLQATAFAGALIVILLSLCGPIDELEDDRLFLAHMAQHLLLCLVMPPLFLLGLTDWMVRPLLMNRWVRPLARILCNPLVAFFTYNAVLVAIHSPGLFDLMCRNDAVHITIHLVLMASGVLLWWPLLSPLPELPRLNYPAQMLYLFVLLIPMAAVAAPITFASGVIYPWYLEGGPHPFGFTPLADQVAGGLLMWVGMGFYVICVATLIFRQWAQRDDCDDPVVNRPLRIHSVKSGKSRAHA
jgi:putative membrane protein